MHLASMSERHLEIMMDVYLEIMMDIDWDTCLGHLLVHIICFNVMICGDILVGAAVGRLHNAQSGEAQSHLISFIPSLFFRNARHKSTALCQ